MVYRKYANFTRGIVEKMTLDGIYGLAGSGKSIIAVSNACYVPKEIPIYVNFNLRLKNAQLIEPEEIFEVFEEDTKQPVKELITDEAYSWMESRGSGFNDINKMVSYMIFQSRKRGLNWKAIAQLRGTLDLRWRGMENRVVYCHERNLDTSGNSTDDFKFSFIKGLHVVNLTMPYENSRQFWNLYDTNQTILPTDFQELRDKIKFKKHPDKLNKYIDDVVTEIMKKVKIPCKTLKNDEIKYFVSDDWVRDTLLRMEKTDAMEYIKYIKSRIKVKLEID